MVKKEAQNLDFILKKTLDVQAVTISMIKSDILQGISPDIAEKYFSILKNHPDQIVDTVPSGTAIKSNDKTENFLNRGGFESKQNKEERNNLEEKTKKDELENLQLEVLKLNRIIAKDVIIKNKSYYLWEVVKIILAAAISVIFTLMIK